MYEKYVLCPNVNSRIVGIGGYNLASRWHPEILKKEFIIYRETSLNNETLIYSQSLRGMNLDNALFILPDPSGRYDFYNVPKHRVNHHIFGNFTLLFPPGYTFDIFLNYPLNTIKAKNVVYGIIEDFKIYE